MSTRNARKKLSPRTATQKGNSGASVGPDNLIAPWLHGPRLKLKYPPALRTPSQVRKNVQAAGCQFEPVRAFIRGATVVVPGPRSFSKTTPR
jgi:hypothetical protein